MSHKVDRVYFEACEINKNINNGLNFITKKQIQLQKKNCQPTYSKEKLESGRFQVDKLMNNVDDFRYGIV
jgi:hypothetical protein